MVLCFYLSGKASIDHYVTPVRAGHIILELGGYCEPEVTSDIDLIMIRPAGNKPWYYYSGVTGVLRNFQVWGESL